MQIKVAGRIKVKLIKGTRAKASMAVTQEPWRTALQRATPVGSVGRQTHTASTSNTNAFRQGFLRALTKHLAAHKMITANIR